MEVGKGVREGYQQGISMMVYDSDIVEGVVDGYISVKGYYCQKIVIIVI